MIDVTKAQELGWELVPTDDGLEALKDGVPVFQVASDIPVFHTLAWVAELEELPFPADRDPATIKKVSGEKYVKPADEPVKKTPSELAVAVLRDPKAGAEAKWAAVADVLDPKGR